MCLNTASNFNLITSHQSLFYFTVTWFTPALNSLELETSVVVHARHIRRENTLLAIIKESGGLDGNSV